MNHQKSLGFRGELAAKKWLLGKKYQIIANNIRISHYEIDLIAKKHDIFIFFEIKTGYYLDDDFPLKNQQLKSLKIARIKYCQIHQIPLEKTRLDLITVRPQKEGANLEHFIDLLN